MAQATRKRTTKAQAAPNADVAVTDDATLARKAEDEARIAAFNASLNDLKGRLADELHELTEGDKDSAVAARLHWVNVGNLLIEGRALFTKPESNNPDNKAFGAWIEENGFAALGQRPTRAGAIWLAEVYNKKPELYAMFPTESKDGEPLRRSPRTLQAWVREEVYAVFQDAWEADRDNVAVASEADKEKRENIARESMPNVYSALAEQLDAARATLDAAQTRMTSAKGESERNAAMRAFNEAAGHLEALTQRKDILDQHDDDERLTLFMNWKPKQKTLTFKDASVDDAANRLFLLLNQHPDFGAVFESLGVLVEEMQAKVDADAGAVDADGGLTDDDDDDNGDVDGDLSDDDAGVDPDFDADDFGDDDLDDADFGDDDE